MDYCIGTSYRYCIVSMVIDFTFNFSITSLIDPGLLLREIIEPLVFFESLWGHHLAAMWTLNELYPSTFCRVLRRAESKLSLRDEREQARGRDMVIDTDLH